MEVFTPMPAKEMADLTRQGVDSFVAAQKALLDVMTRPRRTPPPPPAPAHEPVHHAPAN